MGIYMYIYAHTTNTRSLYATHNFFLSPFLEYLQIFLVLRDCVGSFIKSTLIKNKCNKMI